MLSSLAVVLEQPERIALARLAIDAPAARDVVVETDWSGVSTGTERLLSTGRMPPFPGMGYPLVPGYENVGTVIEAGPDARVRSRRTRFRARRPLLRRGARIVRRRRLASGRAGARASYPFRLRSARRACCSRWPRPPSTRSTAPELDGADLDRRPRRARPAAGAPGRCSAAATPPVVWERNPRARDGAVGYEVVAPDDDPRATIARSSTSAATRRCSTR